MVNLRLGNLSEGRLWTIALGEVGSGTVLGISLGKLTAIHHGQFARMWHNYAGFGEMERQGQR
jgi:hypothetical protein